MFVYVLYGLGCFVKSDGWVITAYLIYLFLVNCRTSVNRFMIVDIVINTSNLCYTQKDIKCNRIAKRMTHLHDKLWIWYQNNKGFINAAKEKKKSKHKKSLSDPGMAMFLSVEKNIFLINIFITCCLLLIRSSKLLHMYLGSYINVWNVHQCIWKQKYYCSRHVI